MNGYEEELQENIERGQVPTGDDLDVKAYQAVFRALKKDPEQALSADFADRIVARITSQQSKILRDYLWFGTGIFVLLLSLIGTILYTKFTFDLGFLKVMSDYRGLALFGIAFITLLNWLDKKLVRERHLSQKA